jgi:predicted glycoside hydrolase/deacetylase ChbG (UPF0249 family)
MNSLQHEISQSENQRPDAAVIVNADDWGRDADNTNRTLECVRHGAVSSVSAMVFMQDSARAAQLAREHAIDAGLHLNFTTPFSASPAPLAGHQRRLARFLRSHRLAPIFYNPFLASSFNYVVQAQIEEYERLFGAPPARFDGHHHMHLCANLLFQNLLPSGTIVRRNFFFAPGEKSFFNRQYRAWQDRIATRRHRMTDYFFLLPADSPQRLKNIFDLAYEFDVEIETHPVAVNDYNLLMSGQFIALAGDIAIARGYTLRSHPVTPGALA